ncbi:hypothetical protein EMIT079MI2_60037 [Bacillus sp. IT-79MI2]
MASILKDKVNILPNSLFEMEKIFFMNKKGGCSWECVDILTK